MAGLLVYLLSSANELLEEQQQKIINSKATAKKAALSETWTNLLSNWSTKEEKLRLARELAYSYDIPNSVRSNVWFVISGAKELMCENCNRYESLCDTQPNSKCLKQIEKDYRRSLGSKQMNLKYQDRLRRILIAYSNYNPSIPYTQGMNFIAAFTLKQYLEKSPQITFIETDENNSGDDLDEETKIANEIVNEYWLNCIEEQAFWTFAAIMSKIDALFCDDLIGFHKAVDSFLKLLTFHGPSDLVSHLNEQNIYPMICTKWYHTLFTHPGMNENIVKRVWDVFIVEKMDFSVILKISYLILVRHKQSLVEMDIMAIVAFCESNECFEFNGSDDHDLIHCASELQLNETYLTDIRNQQYCKSTTNIVDGNSKRSCRMR